jgi:hypothetical protein
MMIRSLFEIFIHSSLPGNEITLTCDECFVVMEFFVDLVLEDLSLDEIKKPLLRHIDHCPDCREHHFQRLREMEEQWIQRRNAHRPP